MRNNQIPNLTIRRHNAFWNITCLEGQLCINLIEWDQAILPGLAKTDYHIIDKPDLFGLWESQLHFSFNTNEHKSVFISLDIWDSW